MVTIGIKCVDQVLSFTNTPLISTGDQNVDKVKFDFCELWNGFIRLAVFYQDKGNPYYSFIGADGIANVPNEIMKLTGSIYIAVTGVNAEDQIRTSNVVRYTIEEGVTESDIANIYSDDLPEEEQADIYHQILELSINMQTLVEDLVKNFAYVRLKDANEFEYDYDKFKVRILEILKEMAYTKEETEEILDAFKVETLERVNSRLNEFESTVNTQFDTFKEKMNSELISTREEMQTALEALTTELSESISATRTELLTAIDDKMVDHVAYYHSN